MTVFELVRQEVTAEDVARLYGLKFGRNGRAVCPWHSDHHPDLRFYENGGAGGADFGVDTQRGRRAYTIRLSPRPTNQQPTRPGDNGKGAGAQGRAHSLQQTVVIPL